MNLALKGGLQKTALQRMCISLFIERGEDDAMRVGVVHFLQENFLLFIWLLYVIPGLVSHVEVVGGV